MLRNFIKGMLRLCLLCMALFFEAPRPSFWTDVNRLRSAGQGEEITDDEVISLIRSVPTHYAFTSFYMNSNGSNSNSGTTAADAGGSDTPIYSSAAGAWVGTPAFTFTGTDGVNPVSDGVAIGDWCNIGSNFIVQVTAVVNAANGVLTFANAGTVFYGTSLATNASITCKDGGAFHDFGITALNNPFHVTPTGVGSTNINVKAGTYANTSTGLTLAAAGTTTTPLWWEGYKATPGDRSSSPTSALVAGTDIPTVTFTTGLITISGNHQTFSSIDFTGAQVTAASGQILCTASHVEFWRCRITCTSANANGIALRMSGVNIFFADGYLQSSSSANVVNGLTGNWTVQASTISGGAIGITLTTGTGIIVNNQFLTQGSHCIQTTGAGSFIIVGNSAYGAAAGDFYNISTTVPLFCVVSDNVTYGMLYGIHNATGTNTNVVKWFANSFVNNTSGISLGLSESLTFDDQSGGSTSPFTSSTNLLLLAAAAAYQKGAPGLFEGPAANTTSVGYLSQGAVQPQPGGGSSAYTSQIIGC
jgi:hypothetical protein